MTFGRVTRVPLVATVLVGAACATAAEPSGVPAFPGAEGAGRMAVGGRGGRVLTVTTLADYDPRSKQSPIVGSLRWAVSQPGPRIVVFGVGGIVELKAGLSIKEPRLTIAGQTAPGDGICLRDGPLVVAADDVVVRHLRVRLGDVQAKEADAISVLDCRRVVLDHCSASWSVDETLSVTGGGCGDVTVQWCIISESLDTSRHHKGTHGYGSLVRTDGEVSFHHNLYAHHRTRCPRPGTYGDPPGLLFDFRNNVIYDWISPAGYTSSDPVRMNYVSNALRPGPSTREKVFMFSVGGPATRIYAAGNTLDHPRTAAADDWTLIEHAKPENRLDAPLTTVSVTTDPAPEAFARVLRSAGATLPRRDAVDARVVEDVRRGTGKVVDSQRDVGGWPDYRTAEAAPDADADGMPDAWERDHGLDPRAEADGAADRDGDGYTNVEEYLNGIDGD